MGTMEQKIETTILGCIGLMFSCLGFLGRIQGFGLEG